VEEVLSIFYLLRLLAVETPLEDSYIWLAAVVRIWPSVCIVLIPYVAHYQKSPLLYVENSSRSYSTLGLCIGILLQLSEAQTSLCQSDFLSLLYV